MRVKGHALISEGAAYQDDPTAFAKKGRVAWSTIAGKGYGLCQCGAQSPILGSAGARKAWHRKHKAELMQQAGAPAETEASA